MPTYGIGSKWCPVCERFYTQYKSANYCWICGKRLRVMTKQDVLRKRIEGLQKTTDRGIERWATLNGELFPQEGALTCEIFYNGKPITELVKED